MATDVLRFLPVQSCVELSFWSEFSDLKLDRYKLSEEPVPLTAQVGASQYDHVPSPLVLDSTSLQHTIPGRAGEHNIPGILYHTNTFESFKGIDKQQLLATAASSIWNDITSGAAEADPALLSRFILLAYGDLKHYRFYSWFAFPALKPPQPFKHTSNSSLADAEPQLFSQLAAACNSWLASASSQPAWLLHQPHDSTTITTAPLSQAQQLITSGSKLWLAFSDASNSAKHPGWALRNLLLLAAARWHLPALQVICVKQTRRATDTARSRIIHVQLPEVPDAWGGSSAPAAVGWSANPQGRLAPCLLDASPMMAPQQLAQQAVALNLRLMRWRAAPQLDIAALADLRCLLLGAGTLGCAVARTLLAWGVRHITMVDSGKVAFSNPVRQWLYSYQDCLQGGRPKAHAAAEQLRSIFPSVTSEGLQLVIPMPGHPAAGAQQEQQQQEDAARLDQLVQQHDAVFLLTDTRESRWLPSLMCAAHNKIAINAALGFDSFVVMRHGAGVPDGGSSQPQGAASDSKPRLGCYFCNDVVAPLNSTVDRALDQQCTVARPGLAPLAGALAVELLAALLQHPLREAAPASSSAAEGAALGAVPHMIRGQLSAFSQVCMEGRAFSCCTACSPAVVREYRRQGWGMLAQAISRCGYLEELSGLQAMLQGAAGKVLLSEDEAEGDGQDEVGGGGAAAAEGGGGGGDDDVADDWTEL